MAVGVVQRGAAVTAGRQVARLEELWLGRLDHGGDLRK